MTSAYCALTVCFEWAQRQCCSRDRAAGSISFLAFQLLDGPWRGDASRLNRAIALCAPPHKLAPSRSLPASPESPPRAPSRPQRPRRPNVKWARVLDLRSLEGPGVPPQVGRAVRDQASGHNFGHREPYAPWSRPSRAGQARGHERQSVAIGCFGDDDASTSGEVLRSWEAIKAKEREAKGKEDEYGHRSVGARQRAFQDRAGTQELPKEPYCVPDSQEHREGKGRIESKSPIFNPGILRADLACPLPRRDRRRRSSLTRPKARRAVLDA